MTLFVENVSDLTPYLAYLFPVLVARGVPTGSLYDPALELFVHDSDEHEAYKRCVALSVFLCYPARNALELRATLSYPKYDILHVTLNEQEQEPRLSRGVPKVLPARLNGSTCPWWRSSLSALPLTSHYSV